MELTTWPVYSVECALKACIAKTIPRHQFPDKEKALSCYTHNLKDLLRVAQLEKALLEQSKGDAVFRYNWEIVQLWSEHSRYATTDAANARSLIGAVGDRNY